MNDRTDNRSGQSADNDNDNEIGGNQHTDQLEQQLRSHFDRRSATITEAPASAATLLTFRREADAGTTALRRRRVAFASVGGIAAMALAIGLIINTQGPQPLDSTHGPADAPTVAGVATGSSTGSTTGAAKAWVTDYDADPASIASGVFPMLTLALPQTTDDHLSSISAVTTERRGAPSISLPAAPIAVLAQLQVGAPLRFVTASVQTPGQLSLGAGGEEITIADRPARVIRDNDGWTRIIWSMDDDHHVLLQSYGVARSDIEQLAATLHSDNSDVWALDPGSSGLDVVDTPAPTSQQALYLSWATPDPANPDPLSGATLSTTDLGLVSGGAYEFWATMANTSSYRVGLPEVIGVDLGGDTLSPAVLVEVGVYVDGSTNATLDVVDPSGTVVHVNLYEAEAEAPATTTGSATETLRNTAPNLLTRLDAPAWQTLLGRALDAAAVRDAQMDELLDAKRAADGSIGSSDGQPPVTWAPTTTMVDDTAARDAGAPAEASTPSTSGPSSSAAPTTTSPATSGPTTTAG